MLQIAALLLLIPAAPPLGLTERFDGPDLPSGWIAINNSAPAGPAGGWHQGLTQVFPGIDGGFAGCDHSAAAQDGILSAWLISPVVTWEHGTTVTFWTRSDGWKPDSLQVRMSLAGDSTDVGTGPFSQGDFTTWPLDINLDFSPGGYPTQWTQYGFRVPNFDGLPCRGRLAFWYRANSTLTFGSYIGIDNVQVRPPRIPFWLDGPKKLHRLPDVLAK